MPFRRTPLLLRTAFISLPSSSLSKPIRVQGLSVTVSKPFCPLGRPIFSSKSRLSNKHRTLTMSISTTPPQNIPLSSDQITGPTWVLDYDSIDSPTLLQDIATAKDHIRSIEAAAKSIRHVVQNAKAISPQIASDINLVQTLVSMFKHFWSALTLLRNISTYASCVTSVDGSNEPAKKLTSQIQVIFSQTQQAYEPASLILDLCPDPIFERFLAADVDTKAAEYRLRHSRTMKDHKLTLQEENVITQLSVTGHSSWATMYQDISSVIPVQVALDDGNKTMGIASAEAMRDSPHEHIRKASWEGIREAWLPHQHTCAAALNAITGWRLDMYKQRDYDSFLTSSLHSNRMSHATLNALLAALDSSTEIGRRALRIQAKALGKSVLQPWDLFAPAPVKADLGRIYSFDDGIELIASAVGKVDKAAGEFVKMMRDNKWIEASRGDKKRPGAYCTGFAKSLTPRVYLSDYNGRAQLLLTLAHELGHAFHSWQMRDLPRPQQGYPMNLAETASIFFETVVGNALLEQSDSAEERFSMLWGEAESAATFLLNIPARYRFEEELNKRRKEGQISVGEIDEMMVSAWERYYGDALGSKDRVGVFSQSKLHFYLTGISFYNWPYSFGYLFSLGVYAEYENGNKDAFAGMYRELLRDTGRMDAEQVVEKHLGGRIDDEEFWKGAIAVAERKVNLLEKAAAEVM